MSRLAVVARREYVETVRKPSFLIFTLLTPLFFLGVTVLPTLVASRTGGEHRVLVLDGTRSLRAGIEASLAPFGSNGVNGEAVADSAPAPAPPASGIRLQVRDSDDPRADAAAEVERVRRGEIDILVQVPSGVVAGEADVTYSSRSAADVFTRRVLEDAVGDAVVELRARARGIDAEQTKRLLARVPMTVEQVTGTGVSARGGMGDLFLAFGFLAMLVIPTIFHGKEIMSGIVLEKSERIVESLVSSMSAFDLLTGKVLGIAAVGLTQIAVWAAMTGCASLALSRPLLAAGVVGSDLVSPVNGVFFVVFFLLGYLMNACVFAMGGACANTEKEAQHLAQPIVMVLMVPWILVLPIMTSPDSPFATALSFFPLYTPTTMFLRIVVGSPPAWQIALSMVGAVLTMVALFVVAARVYRVGILWYGKRPSLAEFLRWMRQP